MFFQSDSQSRFRLRYVPLRSRWGLRVIPVKDANWYVADIGDRTQNLLAGRLNTLTAVPKDPAQWRPTYVAPDMYLFVVVGDGDAFALLLQVVGDRVPKQVGLGDLEAGHHVLLHISGILQ